MNTSYKNCKKSCLRKFRLCWRRKVVIPNIDFKASYNCENSVFSIYAVFPCIHLHVKEQDSKNHYLIISYSTRQYKLSLHLPLNYWYIFKKLKSCTSELSGCSIPTCARLKLCFLTHDSNDSCKGESICISTWQNCKLVCVTQNH